MRWRYRTLERRWIAGSQSGGRVSLASQPMLQALRKSHHAGRTTAAREVRAESTFRDTASGDAGCLWKLNAGSSAGSSSRGYDATNARRSGSGMPRTWGTQVFPSPRPSPGGRGSSCGGTLRTPRLGFEFLTPPLSRREKEFLLRQAPHAATWIGAPHPAPAFAKASAGRPPSSPRLRRMDLPDSSSDARKSEGRGRGRSCCGTLRTPRPT